MSHPVVHAVDFIHDKYVRRRLEKLVDAAILSHIEHNITYVGGRAWSWQALTSSLMDHINP